MLHKYAADRWGAGLGAGGCDHVDSGAMIAVAVVREGQLPLGAAEAVAEAGGRVLLVGSGTAAALAELRGLAREALAAEWGAFAPGTWAEALAPHLSDESAVLLPGSPDGRDLAPRLAASLQRPLLAGAVSVTTHHVEVARSGGSEIHRVSTPPAFVATLVPGVRGAEVDDTLATPTPRDLGPPTAAGSLDATVTGVLPPDPTSIDLSEATRIIGGGAGLDTSDRIDQLTRLGAALGASMGATRVVTDRGWVSHGRQIGTTGVVVDPRLYLAFGVSGAVQHTSGLGSPDHIISVNTDAHCPMMQLADLAIVADANATLDELERLLCTHPATHAGPGGPS